jgi:hypothetical protein
VKRHLVTFVLVTVVATGFAFAQDLGSVVKDLFGTDWNAIFAETGVLAGLIALVIRGINAIRPDTIAGSAKYFTALGLGLVMGAAGGHFGLISVSEFATLPAVLAGVIFGFQAALISVGIHQGVKQTGEALRTTATTRLR